jgi:hypothetical protein
MLPHVVNIVVNVVFPVLDLQVHKLLLSPEWTPVPGPALRLLLLL